LLDLLRRLLLQAIYARRLRKARAARTSLQYARQALLQNALPVMVVCRTNVRARHPKSSAARTRALVRLAGRRWCFQIKHSQYAGRVLFYLQVAIAGLLQPNGRIVLLARSVLWGLVVHQLNKQGLVLQ